MIQQLTTDQIEQMRHMLSLHDAQAAGKGTKEFDLNNPPSVSYRHQDYPCAMYNHETGQSIRCEDGAQKSSLESQGWTREALPPEPEQEVALSAADQAEVAEVDPFLEKRRPGRPKKSA